MERESDDAKPGVGQDSCVCGSGTCKAWQNNSLVHVQSLVKQPPCVLSLAHALVSVDPTNLTQSQMWSVCESGTCKARRGATSLCLVSKAGWDAWQRAGWGTYVEEMA
eukprot:1160300-Pelagomonas_calceolata.AAC.11